MPNDDRMSQKQEDFLISLYNGGINQGLWASFPPELRDAGGENPYESWKRAAVRTGEDASRVIDYLIYITQAIPEGKEIKPVSDGQIRFFLQSCERLAELGNSDWDAWGSSNIETVRHSWTLSMLSRKVEDEIKDRERAERVAAGGATPTGAPPPIAGLSGESAPAPAPATQPAAQPAAAAPATVDADALPFE